MVVDTVIARNGVACWLDQHEISSTRYTCAGIEIKERPEKVDTTRRRAGSGTRFYFLLSDLFFFCPRRRALSVWAHPRSGRGVLSFSWHTVVQCDDHCDDTVLQHESCSCTQELTSSPMMRVGGMRRYISGTRLWLPDLATHRSLTSFSRLCHCRRLQ